MEIGRGHYLTVAAVLFTLGVFGIFLNRKNVIIILMSIELLLLAVNINLVAFSHFLGDLVGQVFISYSLHGEQEQELEFNLNDGTQLTGATPGTVESTVAFTIEKGGFFEAGFSISARCAQERDKDDPDTVASKRSGTLTFSYAASPAP